MNESDTDKREGPNCDGCAAAGVGDPRTTDTINIGPEYLDAIGLRTSTNDAKPLHLRILHQKQNKYNRPVSSLDNNERDPFLTGNAASLISIRSLNEFRRSAGECCLSHPVCASVYMHQRGDNPLLRRDTRYRTYIIFLFWYQRTGRLYYT